MNINDNKKKDIRIFCNDLAHQHYNLIINN